MIFICSNEEIPRSGTIGIWSDCNGVTIRDREIKCRQQRIISLRCYREVIDEEQVVLIEAAQECYILTVTFVGRQWDLIVGKHISSCSPNGIYCDEGLNVSWVRHDTNDEASSPIFVVVFIKILISSTKERNHQVFEIRHIDFRSSAIHVFTCRNSCRGTISTRKDEAVRTIW